MRKIGGPLRAALLLLLGSIATPAWAEPLTIHVGIGLSVEEPLWLLISRPDLTPNQGKAYKVEWTRFTGGDKGMQAFEAGALDIAVTSATAALNASAEGIEFKVIGSMGQESTRGFATEFMVRKDSPIRSPADLKGRKIGINGFSGAGDFWLHTIMRKYGLTKDDVTIVAMPFAVMDDGLRSGIVDVAMFPQPFSAAAKAKGGIRPLFTSKDAAPYDEEMTLVISKAEFLAAHREVMKAFMSDLADATHFYLDHPQEARQALIDGKMVRVSADLYLNMKDYYRDPDDAVHVDSLKTMQDRQIAEGFQEKRADIDGMVDLSFLRH